MPKGKLIAIEGTDGSGKLTTCAGIKQRAVDSGIFMHLMSFPRYDTPTGKIVRAYLDGEFGDPTKVNPYIASVFYAADRGAASNSILGRLGTEQTILVDRFIGSNWAHQGAKLSPEQRTAFVKWSEDYEHRGLHVPKPDFTFCLNLHPEHTRQAIEDRELDGHESDIEYQKKVVETYLWLARTRDDWGLVECLKDGGERKTAEELAEEIWPVIQAVISP